GRRDAGHLRPGGAQLRRDQPAGVRHRLHAGAARADAKVALVELADAPDPRGLQLRDLSAEHSVHRPREGAHVEGRPVGWPQLSDLRARAAGGGHSPADRHQGLDVAPRAGTRPNDPITSGGVFEAENLALVVYAKASAYRPQL